MNKFNNEPAPNVSTESLRGTLLRVLEERDVEDLGAFYNTYGDAVLKIDDATGHYPTREHIGWDLQADIGSNIVRLYVKDDPVLERGKYPKQYTIRPDTLDDITLIGKQELPQ